LSQRSQTQNLLQVEYAQVQIALELGISKNTISRELKQNISIRDQTAYVFVAERIQGKNLHLHAVKTKLIILTDQLKMFCY